MYFWLNSLKVNNGINSFVVTTWKSWLWESDNEHLHKLVIACQWWQFFFQLISQYERVQSKAGPCFSQGHEYKKPKLNFVSLIPYFAMVTIVLLSDFQEKQNGKWQKKNGSINSTMFNRGQIETWSLATNTWIWY